MTTTTKKEEIDVNFSWGGNARYTLRSKNEYKMPVSMGKYSYLRKIKQITQQNPTTLVVTKDNDLYCSSNYHRKMELPDKNEIVKSLSSGHYHSVILTESNKVYSLGSNYYLQLGHSYQNRKIIDEPTRIDYFTKNKLAIKKIQCGYSQTYFLCENSHLYACGSNSNEEFGIETETKGSNQITFCNKDVLDIFSGNYSYFHLFLKEEGLFAAGNNISGQLGFEGKLNITKTKLIELPMGFEHTSIACSNEHTLILGNSSNSQQQLLSSGSSPQNGHIIHRHKFEPIEFFYDHHIKQISVGAYHSMVLTEEQRIFCFGQNTYHQLGKERMATCKPTEVIIPEIKNHTNLQIYAGCYCGFVFHSDYYADGSVCNNYSLLSRDFLQLFRTEPNFSDSSIKEVKFHKTFVESRIGKPIDKIEQVLNGYTKEQIIKFIEWVYSGKLVSSAQRKLIEDICMEFGITDRRQMNLQNDLLKLFKDQDTKDFYILVKDYDDDYDEEKEEDDDDEEESYEKIPVHKFVLLARSGLFRDMFQNTTQGSNSVKDYSQKSFESIQVLVEYFYTNTINTTADNDPEFIIEELQDSAEYYQLSNDRHFRLGLKKILKKNLYL
ncbi:btk-binding protein-related [Anaeramoeba flamelloides]|uniref:Btk-binding protein-related n=1 Tax=Anaeramoeba flamelloides TaxID=1746091 RepID=A0AAV7ZT17_9EUKA|nr:btk-binding protein-related [Anaeramoeba flamelloides]